MNCEEAVDAIANIVNDFAIANSLPVEWPDLPFDKPDTGSYIKYTIRHAIGLQAALSMNAAKKRLWENAGVCGVIVNSPIASGNTVGYTLANLLKSALRANNSAVWFRNIRIRELGSEGGYTQITVLWDFEYRDTE